MVSGLSYLVIFIDRTLYEENERYEISHCDLILKSGLFVCDGKTGCY